MRGFNYDGSVLSSIAGIDVLAFATGLYGALVGPGDLDGDRVDELACGHGPDSASDTNVRGFGYDAAAGTLAAIPGADFLAFRAVVRYGCNVSTTLVGDP